MAELIDTLPPVRGRLTAGMPMSRIGWLQVGGPAEVLFQPAAADDLADFLKSLDPGVHVMPVGVGSNLIIRDGGLDGVVIRLSRGFNATGAQPGSQVRAGAAALDAHVATRAAEAGIDLAFLRTIPGTIGGAARMNAGCYGTCMADVFVEADAITRDGTCITLARADMGFAYRTSMIPEGAVITSVLLQGTPGDPKVIKQRMKELLARRAATQPVTARTCGSAFRNPAGCSSAGQARDVHDFKAWKVIDDAGMRGARCGGAQISRLHSNFLVNRGDATAADLENLGERVRKRVFDNSGITLEWEIMRAGKPA
ncbi:MAG: UDP-N-acetylmuramate dehydrogenase [Rhodobacteraceae bacterium]|nr:UDP-N-acetylmuramate dehydrogenase [Paracoccaceae bacterium]